MGCFTAADGRQLKRSTRTVSKTKALEIARAWEEIETNSARGYLSTEEQFRLFVDQKFRFLFGKDSQLELTIRSWLEQWLANTQGTVTPGALKGYHAVVRDFLAVLGSRASLCLDALSTSDAIAYRDYFLGLGKSEGTVNNRVAVLSMSFKQAWKEGYIRRNPFEGVKPLRYERAQKGTFTPQQILQLLAVVQGTEWYTLILAGYYTGARLMDLARLKWENIDLAEGSLSFTQHKTEHHGEGAKLKVPLHPELLDHLLSLPASDNPLAPILPRLSRTRGSHLSIKFKQFMAEAGIDAGIAKQSRGKGGKTISRLSFHALRHSFTSALANAGVPAELRQKLTGHLDAKSHAIYTHLEFERIREALEKLARLPKKDGE
jgi:integrase